MVENERSSDNLIFLRFRFRDVPRPIPSPCDSNTQSLSPAAIFGLRMVMTLEIWKPILALTNNPDKKEPHNISSLETHHCARQYLSILVVASDLYHMALRPRTKSFRIQKN